MAEFLIANMAPIMFASMIVFLLVGFPVAFALAANGILFGLIGIQLGLLGPQLFQALPDRIYGIMANDTLLAVPFFTFMGLILERSGMAHNAEHGAVRTVAAQALAAPFAVPAGVIDFAHHAFA